jgi:hypothetical protein
MVDKTQIRTVGTVYLAGQVRGFPPGSEFALRTDHATALIKEGRAEDMTPKPRPATAGEHAAEVLPAAAEPKPEEPAADPHTA